MASSLFWDWIVSLRARMWFASKTALRLQKEGAWLEAKGPLDVVTEADKAIENILGDWLTRYCPDDGVVGEEGMVRRSLSENAWYIDPIDGTKNFASGLPFFGISLGRAWNGNGTYGWLCFPALGKNLVAQVGEGVWDYSFGKRRQGVEKKPFSRPFRESVIALGITPGNEHLFEAFKKKCWNAVALGAFVYETLLVIEGHYSAYVHTGATPFDAAAAVVIVRELDLAVSRLDRKPIDLREPNIPIVIAQNRQILEEVLEICKSGGGTK